MNRPMHFDIDAARLQMETLWTKVVEQARATEGADQHFIDWQDELQRKVIHEIGILHLSAKNREQEQAYARALGLAVGRIIHMMGRNLSTDLLASFLAGINRYGDPQGSAIVGQRDVPLNVSTEGGNA